MCDRETNLIYIASPSFSGSTLLTFLLASHPDIATIGELKWWSVDLEDYRCSCGELLKECGFWASVRSEMASRGIEFDLADPKTRFRLSEHGVGDRVLRARVRGRLFETVRSGLLATLPGLSRFYAETIHRNRNVMQVVMALQGGRMFLDGSKEPIRLKHFAQAGGFNIRVIHLIRDGRAVTNSGIKNQQLTVERSAREWVLSHRQIERLDRHLAPNRLMRLRYEDLCADPGGNMREVFEFLGLDAAKADQDFHAGEQHILGNRMRLTFSSKIELDEKWRSMLTTADLEVFERIGGELNRRYGYE